MPRNTPPPHCARSKLNIGMVATFSTLKDGLEDFLGTREDLGKTRLGMDLAR